MFNEISNIDAIVMNSLPNWMEIVSLNGFRMEVKCIDLNLFGDIGAKSCCLFDVVEFKFEVGVFCPEA